VYGFAGGLGLAGKVPMKLLQFVAWVDVLLELLLLPPAELVPPPPVLELLGGVPPIVKRFFLTVVEPWLFREAPV
jgi:hypothetical protein